MKYPIYNRFAYATLSLIDLLLSPLRRTKPIPEKPSRILVSNIAHLGDAILTTTLLPALKELYPEVEIGMLVGNWSRPVLENNRMITWIHTLNHWKINRGQRCYFRTRKNALREIREIDYEMAIDCNFHFPNAAPLLWRAKIPTRIGFESAGFGPLLTHTSSWNPRENKSAVEAYFSLLSLSPSQPPRSSKKKGGYLVIHIGSGDPKKEWPLQKWRELTKKLSDEGHELYFTGKGRREEEMIDEVISNLPQAHNFCDRLSWKEFVKVIERARLLIGVDTSAGHVAATVNTPGVLLFTGIHPPKLWAPFHPNIQTLTKPMPCSTCLRGCESMDCIREISVERVYQAIQARLCLKTLCFHA